MPPRWDVVLRDPDYQSLPDSEKLQVKTMFFRNVVARDPDFQGLPSSDRVSLGQQFFSKEFNTAGTRQLIASILEPFRTLTKPEVKTTIEQFPERTPFSAIKESPGLFKRAAQEALFPPILPASPRTLARAVEPITPKSIPELGLAALPLGRFTPKAIPSVPAPSRIITGPAKQEIEVVFEKGLPIFQKKGKEITDFMSRAVEGTEKIVNDFKANLPKIIADPEKVIAFKQGDQITDIIISGIEDGSIAPKEGARLFNVELGAFEGPKQLAQRLRAISTGFGQGLNRLSQASKELDALVGGSPELRQALAAIRSPKGGARIVDFLLNPLGRMTDKVINFWKSALLSMPGGAARDALGQGVRTVAGLFNDVMNGTLRYVFGKETAKAAFSNAIEDVMAFVRKASPTQRKIIDKVLSEFDTARTIVSQNTLSDLTLSGRTSRFLTALRRVQETFYRRAAFDARLRSNLTRVGATISDLSRIPRRQAEMLVNDAALHALDMTFARNPTSGFGKAILNVYRQAPIINLFANPFPKYWMSALRFTTEFSPLGLAFTNLGSKNPELALQGLSKALTGTVMLTGAWAARKKWGGEKWYLFKPDPNKPSRQLDVRNQNPYSVYAFVADFMDRTLDVLSGKRFNLGYSPEDIANAILALKRTDFSGIPFLDNFVFNREELLSNPEKLMQGLKLTVGNFLSGFGVPFKVLRDYAEGGWSGEQVIRETKQSPLSGGFLESIPIFRTEFLPEARTPTRKEALVRPEPLKRQVTGFALVKRDEVQRELDKHDINPREIVPHTGDPETDRLVTAAMSDISDAALRFVRSEEYTNIPDPERKRFALLKIFSEMESRAKKFVLQQRPDLELALRSKRLDVPRPEKQRFKKEAESMRIPNEFAP